MNLQFAKILILAPHTDDGEFGCGGSIAKFAESGTEIYYAAFSLAEESVPPPNPKNILETEVKAATKVLEIKPEHLLLYRYQVRHFATHRQSILEDLVTLNQEIKPDLVLMPSLHDLHQDHSTISMEGLRAFKKTSILAYEMPWNNLNFSTQSFIKLSEKHIEKKIKALECYKSQSSKDYASEQFIRSLALTRGTQIGVKYAEAFEVLRWIF
ncbi:MAG: PIG-L family deacetylase [Bacteroidales bacterium]|jgi:LmbE family N-acetylglucosaminyl deacetylase|nr:PIG-L family deacetylase [Bacteroidales bacterium]